MGERKALLAARIGLWVTIIAYTAACIAAGYVAGYTHGYYDIRGIGY